MKWTPLKSKLRQPLPVVPWPNRSMKFLPLSTKVSCSPGMKYAWLTLAPLTIWLTVSNWSDVERWVRSPVCRLNAGGLGSALTRATACCNVPVTSWLGTFLKPMWLSLICAKLKLPVDAPWVAASAIVREERMPAEIVQISPAPARAMHLRKPRRSTSSPPSARAICSGVAISPSSV